ncbi:MAG TPA: cytochrome C oxidase subunit IV family protein [Gemmatimonadales bacterium]|jgi:caa(3)-type oxidase subunit IV|nr:cytochrome C oxidase subunit IV family protein [Gemmatimonadales bacterium]
MHAVAHAEAHAETHAHPTPGLYARVAITLFVLTALEVAAYEVARDPVAPLHGAVEPILVPILLVLSAAKFALVAMFYMHLKQDEPLLSGVFVFALIIAALIIVALMILFSYQYHVAPTINPKRG